MEQKGKIHPEPPVTEITGVTVGPKTNNLEVGATRQLNATVEPTEAPQDVSYSSSDESIATVSEGGLVTAIGAGQATITVRAGEKSDTATVNVTEPEPEPEPEG